MSNKLTKEEIKAYLDVNWCAVRSMGNQTLIALKWVIVAWWAIECVIIRWLSFDGLMIFIIIGGSLTLLIISFIGWYDHEKQKCLNGCMNGWIVTRHATPPRTRKAPCPIHGSPAKGGK